VAESGEAGAEHRAIEIHNMNSESTMIHFDEALAAVVSAASKLVSLDSFEKGAAIILRDVTGAVTLVLRDESLYPARGPLAERLIVLQPYVDEQPVATVDDFFDDSLRDNSIGFLEWVKLSDGVEIEVRVVDRRIVGADWQRAPYQTPVDVPIFVYWSIKGGVGRSTALCVAAAALARDGMDILTVDLDLEAPGIGDMLLNEVDRPAYGALDFYIENGFGRADPDFMRAMLGPSRLTTSGGLISVVPATGKATDQAPHNMLAKLARSYTEKLNQGSFLDQTRELLKRLVEDNSYDAIFVDARAGLNESTAASILGLGGTVFLFGVDTAQNFRDYRYAFSHLNRFIGEERDNSWRDRLQMIHAKASASEARRKHFRDRAYDLFAEWIYDEASYDDAEAFNFDLDDSSAPHFGWPIFYDSNFRDFDLFEHPELLDTKMTEGAFGEFLSRITGQINLRPGRSAGV
jgi:hypothetical protein